MFTLIFSCSYSTAPAEHGPCLLWGWDGPRPSEETHGDSLENGGMGAGEVIAIAVGTGLILVAACCCYCQSRGLGGGGGGSGGGNSNIRSAEEAGDGGSRRSRWNLW